MMSKRRQANNQSGARRRYANNPAPSKKPIKKA